MRARGSESGTGGVGIARLIETPRAARQSGRCVLSLVLAVVATLAAGAVGAASFRISVLPDTQFYSDTGDDDGVYFGLEDPFNFQVQWIVDNSTARGTEFVIHLGDIVDDSDEVGQWVFADAAMRRLDDALQPLDSAGIPYGVVRGNHDGPIVGDATFLDWFGPARFDGKPTYRGSGPYGYNSYHVFEVAGQPFLVLLTDWRMDGAEISWARGVLERFSKVPTIFVSHQIIGAADSSIQPASATNATDTGNGEFLWDELIKDNDQVFLTLNGHLATAAWRIKANAVGNDVLQVLADYQQQFRNGAGYLLELTIDTDAGTVNAETFSPWLELARTTLPAALLRRAPPTRLTGPSNEFQVDLDFSGTRFCTSAEACGLMAPTSATVPFLPAAGLAAALVGIVALGLASGRRRF